MQWIVKEMGVQMDVREADPDVRRLLGQTLHKMFPGTQPAGERNRQAVGAGKR